MTGDVEVSGPMNQAELAALEKAYEQRQPLRETLEWLARRLKAARSEERRAELRDAQHILEERLTLINSVLNDGGGQDMDDDFSPGGEPSDGEVAP